MIQFAISLKWNSRQAEKRLLLVKKDQGKQSLTRNRLNFDKFWGKI